MSKMQEYLDASIGYDSSGLPSSAVQFTFGMSPFLVADTEAIEDVTEISAICESNAVVDMQILDDIAMVTFDFSLELETLVELVEELEMYKMQRKHTTDVVNDFMTQMEIAERNNDEKEMENIALKLRSLSVPFMLPTLIPSEYGGSVNVGFTDPPKFFFYTCDNLNENPYKLTMIFDAHCVFAQDELGIYMGTTEEELEAQQAELWYLQEAKKAEEEAFRAQYGLGDFDPYEEEENNNSGNKKLKGVRFS